MKSKFLIIFVVIIAIPLFFFLSQGSNNKSSTSPADATVKISGQERDAFVDSVIALNKARDLSNKGLPLPRNLPQEVENEIFSLTEKGISLNKQVGDEFLDSLHPELKLMYREKLIKGSMLWLEGVRSSESKEGVEKQLQGNQFVTEWIDWFAENGKSFEGTIF